MGTTALRQGKAAKFPNEKITCHPERSPALFLSRRILAGEGRKGGSGFRGTIDNLSQL